MSDIGDIIRTRGNTRPIRMRLRPKRADQTFAPPGYGYRLIVNAKQSPSAIGDVNLFEVAAVVVSEAAREIVIEFPMSVPNATKPAATYYYEVEEQAPDATTRSARTGRFQLVQRPSSPRP